VCKEKRVKSNHKIDFFKKFYQIVKSNKFNTNYKRYPDYTFIYDEQNAKTAVLSGRYTPESAQGVILDIHFLSQCDYLVCTFSSQVCRMAYELMQDRFPDASWRFKSLDDVYYFGGQNGHSMKAIYDHVARRDLGEIDLKIGDLVGLAGNHWNGYSKVKNFRTNQEGLAPSYKLNDVIEIF
jgi:glycoprotein 6-alpha-L-fucosyltransferase